MARRAKMSSFTGICQQIFVFACTAFHTSKTIMENTTVQILIDYFFYMRSLISIFFAEISLIGSFKLLIIVFDALVVMAILGFSPSVLFCALA